MTARTAIALGSNLGNRLRNLQDARDLLAKAGSHLKLAPVYQTEPVNCPPDSPDFYNTVVSFDYHGTPAELLTLTQAIEQKLGRGRTDVRNAPRVIDVDILLLGGERVVNTVLELPHPRLLVRRFVLQPLAEIEPDLILPGDDATLAEHLRHLDSEEPPLALVQAAW